MLLISLILAILCGLFFGLLFPAGMRLIGIPLSASVGLESGLLAGGMSFVAILLLFQYQKKRLQKAIKKLPSAHTHAFTLHMLLQNKSLPISVFLCEDCLCLVDMDKRNLPVTIYPADEIIRAFRISDREMELHLTQERKLTFRTGATEALYSALKDRGWLPLQG